MYLMHMCGTLIPVDGYILNGQAGCIIRANVCGTLVPTRWYISNGQAGRISRANSPSNTSLESPILKL